MKNQFQIKCPNCSILINVEEMLANQLEEEIKQIDKVLKHE